MTIDLSNASPIGRAIAQSILDKKTLDKRLTVPVKEAQVMLGEVSDAHLMKLIDANKVQSFILGGKRAVHVDSIYDYLAESALFSHPVDGPPRKIERPIHEALRQRKERGLPVKGLSGGAVMHEHGQARKAAKAEKAKPEPFRSQPLA